MYTFTSFNTPAFKELLSVALATSASALSFSFFSLMTCCSRNSSILAWASLFLTTSFLTSTARIPSNTSPVSFLPMNGFKLPLPDSITMFSAIWNTWSANPFSIIATSSSRSLLIFSIFCNSIIWVRSSFLTPWRVKTLTPITVPSSFGPTRSDVSLTFSAFSPKMLRNNASSGVNKVSDFGVTRPTKMSPCFTRAPT